MRISLDCLVPLEALVTSQMSWIALHENFMILAVFVAFVAVFVFVLEGLGVIDWDGFARGFAVASFVVALALFFDNSYWRTVASTNPAYYAYASCPERFAAPSPAAIPMPGVLR